MKRSYNRKTAPKVIDGVVKRKNNHTKTATLGYVVDRERPGRGFRHVLRKKGIHDFTDLIPDWDTHSKGIESILLCRGDGYTDGLYRHFSYEETGIIYLCAWDDDMWGDVSEKYFHEHRWIFDSFGLVYEKRLRKEPNGRGKYTAWGCYFSDSQARAFMLAHIFLHELGHHVDKLRSRSRDTTIGGEPFAEDFSKKMFQRIWPAYVDRFGSPERQ